MILDRIETLEPKRGNLIEDCALVRDWVGQDHIESRDAIGYYKQQRLAKIKDFAHLAAAQFFDSGKLDGGLCGHLHGQMLNAPRSTFNSHVERSRDISDLKRFDSLTSRSLSLGPPCLCRSFPGRLHSRLRFASLEMTE